MEPFEAGRHVAPKLAVRHILGTLPTGNTHLWQSGSSDMFSTSSLKSSAESALLTTLPHTSQARTDGVSAIK